MNSIKNKILVTGSAGFIGYSLSTKLLALGEEVIGVDNHNDYYDPMIKNTRVENLKKSNNYHHYKVDISDKNNLEDIFKLHKPKIVINLAAQAGVRYSL